MEFHQTRMGHKFYDHDFPEAIRQLTRIANALEKKEGYVPAVEPSRLVADVAQRNMNWEAPEQVILDVAQHVRPLIMAVLEAEAKQHLKKIKEETV